MLKYQNQKSKNLSYIKYIYIIKLFMLTRILVILWIIILAIILCVCSWEDDIKMLWYGLWLILITSSPIWWGLLARELLDSNSKTFHIIWVIIFVIVMIICFLFFNRNE